MPFFFLLFDFVAKALEFGRSAWSATFDAAGLGFDADGCNFNPYP